MSGCASDDYMMMTVNAYSAALGEYAGVFIALSVVLFGLATVLCWGHYGMESAELLAKGRRGSVAFIPVYCICVVLGAVLSGEYVWELADLAIGGMTVINLCVLFCMRGEVREETDRLLSRRR
jgi:AGCS family alanine or glycine:cation symporter